MKHLIWIISLLFVLPGCGKHEAHHEETHEHHDHTGESRAVHMDLEFQKMTGLQLEEVKKEKVVSSIEVVGELAQETDQVVHVTADSAGVLEAYLVELGQTVDEGTPLCRIGLNEGKSVTLKSTAHGTVLAKYLKPGEHVDTLTSIMTVADPDLMRAGFDIYERDLSQVAVGQRVEVKTEAYPEKVFEGKIIFISPRVDSKSRTIKIRVDVENEEHLLKFGMFVTGSVQIPSGEKILSIPQEALQQNGSNPVVFVPGEDDDEFLVRKVKPGRTINTKTEILEGLSEGEKVVVRGAFYLKSELMKGEFGDGHNH